MMKKYINIILIFFVTFLFPFIVNAEENIMISDIDFVESSPTTVINKDPSFDKLTMNFDVSFSNVDDFIKYKVTITNNSKRDYKISDNISNYNTSEYIRYEFLFDNHSNVVKAGDKKILFVTIQYMKAVSPEALNNGKFVEEKQMSIPLSNNQEIVNPKTGNNFVLIVFFLICIVAIAFCVSNEKYANSIMAIIFGILIVPGTVYALETLQINVNSRIEITKTVCYNDDGNINYYPYKSSTVGEFFVENDLRYPLAFKYYDDKIDKVSINNRLSELTNGQYTDFGAIDNFDTFYHQIVSHNYPTVSDEIYSLYENYNGYYIFNSSDSLIDSNFGCYEYNTK